MNFFDLMISERKLYERYMSEICDKHNLTSMELAILLFLKNNPEYDTAADIIRRRHLTKSHVSISLRALEEKRYIRKEYRNGDHRTCHLVLLKASNKVVKEGLDAQKRFFSVMTKGFSKSELAEIQNQLLRIYENLTNELNSD